MAYYSVCPKCGANLDPGERCDCGDGLWFHGRYGDVRITGTNTRYRTQKQLAEQYGFTASGVYKQIRKMRESERYGGECFLGSGRGMLVYEGAYLDYMNNKYHLKDKGWLRYNGKYKKDTEAAFYERYR